MNRETAEAYGLAAVGAVQGVYRYYVKPHIEENPGALGWLAVGIGVTAWDLTQAQTLSNYVHERTRPIERAVAVGAVAVTAAHLLRPPSMAKFDPITQMAKKLGI